MTTAQLQALLAVVDAGSFSAAALDLGLAQSSVSRAVAELERDLGVRLLRRGRRGASPTEVGLRVATHARRMLELAEGIRQEAAADTGRLTGRLRVAGYPSIVRFLVAEVLSVFGARHPGVELELHEVEPIEVERLVREGGVDLGFALLPTLDELIAFEVDRDRCVAVVPPDWSADAVAGDDFARAPFILYDDPVCERLIVEYFERLGVTVRPAYRLHENATILSVVARGLGISIMPASAVPAEEGVRCMALPAPLDRVTGVALRPERLAFPVVGRFLALLRERGLIGGAVPAAPAEERAGA